MKNKFSLKGKVVCLVGGTGLIGSALVKDLLNMEATLYVLSRHIPKAKKKKVRYLSVDMKDEKSIQSAIAEVIKKHKRIDIWINSALPKIDYTNIGWEKIETTQMLEDIHVHLLGYFNCCRFALKEMKKRKKGVIVNVGSIHGDVVPDFRVYKNTEIKKAPTYFIIKSGIHMLTKYFSIHGADYNVRVNTVAPGGVYDNHSKVFKKQYSDKVPLKRMANPEEISGPVIFLSSEASSYVTGQTLFVDGGLTTW